MNAKSAEEIGDFEELSHIILSDEEQANFKAFDGCNEFELMRDMVNMFIKCDCSYAEMKRKEAGDSKKSRRSSTKGTRRSSVAAGGSTSEGGCCIVQ